MNGARGNLEDGQLGDYPVAKGYALAGSSLNVFGTHANDVVSAETMMMVKEHFIEEFGPVRWTIGSGRSGGSMQQHMIAQQLSRAARRHRSDGELRRHDDVPDVDARLRAARSRDDGLEAAVYDGSEDRRLGADSHWDYCTNNKLRYAAVAADINCDATTIPQSMRFDPVKKPDGVRCTYSGLAFVNVFGATRRPASRGVRLTTSACKYGLAAFNAGKINFNQFLDINRLAGGHDINGNIIADRTLADPDALRSRTKRDA